MAYYSIRAVSYKRQGLFYQMSKSEKCKVRTIDFTKASIVVAMWAISATTKQVLENLMPFQVTTTTAFAMLTVSL